MLQTLKKLTDRPKPGQADFLVTDGTVGCPNSAAAQESIDTCLACPRLMKAYVDAGGQTWIRCTPGAAR